MPRAHIMPGINRLNLVHYKFSSPGYIYIHISHVHCYNKWWKKKPTPISVYNRIAYEIRKQYPLPNNRINKSPFVNDINSKFTLKLFIEHAFYTTISLYFIKSIQHIPFQPKPLSLCFIPPSSKISLHEGNSTVYLFYTQYTRRMYVMYVYNT